MCLSFTFMITYQRERDLTFMLIHSFSTSAALLWLPRGEPVWRTLSRISRQLLLSSRYQKEIETCWRAVTQRWLVSSKGTESFFHQWTRIRTPLSHAVPYLPFTVQGWKIERYFAGFFQWWPNNFHQPQWGQHQEQVLLRTLLEMHTQIEMQSSHRIQGLSQLLHKSYCHGLPSSLASCADDPNCL